MAFVYLDFNKSANGDGTWANAYSWIQGSANTSANCVVADTIASGDEIRIVGRDYFTHSFASNTVFYANSLNNGYQLTFPTTTMTGNCNILWFKDVRPEAGSGVWAQNLGITVNASNTYLGFYGHVTGVTPVRSIPLTYTSFSNSTHVFTSSAVQAINLNTSTLTPIVADNTGIVWGGTGSTYYLLGGLKANTLITDNWTGDGVRDTTTNSNNKTIICFANTGSVGSTYKNLYVGSCLNSQNVTFDLRNTVLCSITGPTPNTVVNYTTVRYILQYGSGASANTSEGMSYDIGALSQPSEYQSNLEGFLVTNATTDNWSPTVHKEHFLRIRSISNGGYIYYPFGNISPTPTSTYLGANLNYNLRIDAIIVDNYYCTNQLPIGTMASNSVFTYILGDIFTNTTGSVSVHTTGLNYSQLFGFLSSNQSANGIFRVLYDRSRITNAFAKNQNVPCNLPVCMGSGYSYLSYIISYNNFKCIANGTITLSAHNVFRGSPFTVCGSGAGPGSLLSTTVTGLPTNITTLSSQHGYFSDGTLDEYYKAGYRSLEGIRGNLNRLDCLSPIDPVLMSTQSHPSYRVYELPVMPSGVLPFGFTQESYQGPTFGWYAYKSIIVDRDQNFGNTGVEYIPVVISSYSSSGYIGVKSAYLPVTACTDVVSTGSSLKFNISSVSIPILETNNAVSFANVNISSRYSQFVKIIDIPMLSNTDTKTFSFYIKKDANTSVANVQVYTTTVNSSSYSNTSANNFLPRGTLIRSVVNTSLTSSYVQYSNTFTHTSYTGNKVIFVINAIPTGVAPNGAIYIDSITIT